MFKQHAKCLNSMLNRYIIKKHMNLSTVLCTSPIHNNKDAPFAWYSILHKYSLGSALPGGFSQIQNGKPGF